MYLAAFRTGNVLVLLRHLFQKRSKHLAAALALQFDLLVTHTCLPLILMSHFAAHPDDFLPTCEHYRTLLCIDSHYYSSDS